MGQAVQASPFLVTPLHRFLAVLDGSSCGSSAPSIDVLGRNYGKSCAEGSSWGSTYLNY